MAVTFTLVSQGTHHITYLATSTTTTLTPNAGTIQATGVGNADVAMEDAVIPPAGTSWSAGLLKQLIDTTGITTNAQAQRLGQDIGLGSGTPQISNVPGSRIRVTVTLTEGLTPFSVTAVASGGRLAYTVTTDDANDGGTALIHIEAVGTPQQF